MVVTSTRTIPNQSPRFSSRSSPNGKSEACGHDNLELPEFHDVPLSMEQFADTKVADFKIRANFFRNKILASHDSKGLYSEYSNFCNSLMPKELKPSSKLNPVWVFCLKILDSCSLFSSFKRNLLSEKLIDLIHACETLDSQIVEQANFIVNDIQIATKKVCEMLKRQLSGEYLEPSLETTVRSYLDDFCALKEDPLISQHYFAVEAIEGFEILLQGITTLYEVNKPNLVISAIDVYNGFDKAATALENLKHPAQDNDKPPLSYGADELKHILSFLPLSDDDLVKKISEEVLSAQTVNTPSSEIDVIIQEYSPTSINDFIESVKALRDTLDSFIESCCSIPGFSKKMSFSMFPGIPKDEVPHLISEILAPFFANPILPNVDSGELEYKVLSVITSVPYYLLDTNKQKPNSQSEASHPL